jgi:hypothetical protein
MVGRSLIPQARDRMADADSQRMADVATDARMDNRC